MKNRMRLRMDHSITKKMMKILLVKKKVIKKGT